MFTRTHAVWSVVPVTLLVLSSASARCQDHGGAAPDPARAALVPPPVETPVDVVPAPPPDRPVTGDRPDSSAPQAEPFGNGMGRDFRPSVFRADYRVAWFPDEPVSGQNTNLGFVREDLSVIVPFWHDGCNDVSGTFHLRNETFRTLAILPDTGQRFPQELWDIRLGASYRHLFDNGRIAGTNISLGSSGDQPFGHLRDLTGAINLFLTLPQGERNAWLFSVSYSTNSELPFPIPGVAYVWQPADNFRANIGLPFQIMYRPVDDLTLDASYMLLRTARARATYRLAPWLRAYAGYDLENEAYPLADRPDVHDRLFYYDQRASAGLQVPVLKNATLDLSGGYTFDRFYFEGQHFSDATGNRIDVGAGPYLALQLRAHW
jgi:hypothetical protein